MNARDTQNMYRRLGKFLSSYWIDNRAPPLTGEEPVATTTVSQAVRKGPSIFVLAKSRHFGHELSFEKYSNCGWHN